MSYINARNIRKINFKGEECFFPKEVSLFIGRSQTFATTKINDGTLKEGMHYHEVTGNKSLYSIRKDNQDIHFHNTLKRVITLKGFKYLYDHFNKFNHEFPFLVNGKEAKLTQDKPEKKNVAEFVRLTKSEYDKLIEKYGEENTWQMIESLNNYKGATGKKYNSDYLAILNWVAAKVMEKQPNKEESKAPKVKEYLLSLERRIAELSNENIKNVKVIAKLEARVQMLEESKKDQGFLSRIFSKK